MQLNQEEQQQIQEQFENDELQVQSKKSFDPMAKALLENQYNLPSVLNDYEGPTLFYCKVCRQESISICEYKTSCNTFCCAFMLFILFNIFGVFIPFCVNTCKDRIQKCPLCNNIVGVHQYQACEC